jgi:dCTP deaminase
MSIKSDRWITAQCTQPNYMVYSCKKWAPAYLTPEQVERATQTRRQFPNLAMDRHIRPITEEELATWQPMISPFMDKQVRNVDVESFDTSGKSLGEATQRRIVSYGVSSFGYDVALANEFKIFTNINSTVINPKAFDEKAFVDFVGDVCIIPPNSFVLARSAEYFAMPDDVTGVVLGKSTYARCGISCLATPLEAGWEGHITLEFANTTPLPAMLFANEGGAQVLFFQGDEPASVTYRDRDGKYMKQRGITLPKT